LAIEALFVRTTMDQTPQHPFEYRTIILADDSTDSAHPLLFLLQHDPIPSFVLFPFPFMTRRNRLGWNIHRLIPRVCSVPD
jgi:hypothetical protein